MLEYRRAVALHDDEFPIDDGLVSDLVRAQAPQWSSDRLRRLETSGTVNVVYRLGDDRVVRLPRSPDHATGPQREARWMPRFSTELPLRVPAHLVLGEPTERYPMHWSILEWIDGTVADETSLTDLDRAAVLLGATVTAMRRVPTAGAPAGGNYRAFGLAKVDQTFRSFVERLPEDLDRSAVIRVWDSCLAAQTWTGPPTWLHSDLRGDNLIARAGEIVAVIDWEGCTVGDPSADLLAAWWLFDGDSRETFRRAVSQATASDWERAKGWALHMAVLAIPYYADTNPGFVGQARRALAEILA